MRGKGKRARGGETDLDHTCLFVLESKIENGEDRRQLKGAHVIKPLH